MFEPRFSSSQVVCAIGKNIDFYETTFFKPDYEKRLRLENYGDLKNDLEGFNWDYRLDEDHYSDSEVGTPNMYASQADYEDYKRWFSRLMKKPHRTIKFKEPIGEATESYSFKKGEVWLGQK